ncbi:FKBP-type peptidyl-prolyl cis-trans isomerase [Arthrobacter polaris]|uniref:FKBP-type peptidyl-prolyl cis-trans isomerase n=1 Tax=Arthrobacter polaris TaxID=2813727 RepID=UPI001F27F65A|nr:FKBP-type peptidyl-prolyl cis-trans isomerase [Arthrobacter polaris]UIK89966.1 FKBP-type peptidyl-prolyl cis-trans isomerase [Arthrobacter polaris]
MRRLLALVVPLVLLVSACAQGPPDPPGADPSLPDSLKCSPWSKPRNPPALPIASASVPPPNLGVLASVQVVDLGEGHAPKVTFAAPLAIEEQSIALITPGDGMPVLPGQLVHYRQIVVDALTENTLLETFTEDAGSGYVFNDSFRLRFPDTFAAFTSAKVGAFIGEATRKGQRAAVVVFQIVGTEDAPDGPKLLCTDEVTALVNQGKLPVATFDASRIPRITIPENEAPVDLAVQVLTEGSGEVIGANDTITALYTGWTWEDGEQFDSAYDRGQADTFDFHSVLEGWFVGLTGQKVGSTIQLSIPESMAYGEQAAGVGRPAGPLVYVIKIESKV